MATIDILLRAAGIDQLLLRLTKLIIGRCVGAVGANLAAQSDQLGTVAGLEARQL